VTLALVGAGLLLSFVPGAAEALEFDRRLVQGGQIWRPLSGQLVHWTARMTLVDLGVILLLGAWLETRSRRLLAISLVSAAALIATGLHLLPPRLDLYRGSSGLATALFVCVALVLLGDRRLHWKWRGLALLALLLLAVKISWELWSGAPLAAGHLPPGVKVTTMAHLLGAIAGAAAFMACGRLTPSDRPK